MSLLEFDCRHRYPGGFQLEAAFELDCAVTALFGPSGSGKTSTLSIIAGFTAPQHGLVRLGGKTLLDTAGRVHVRPERRHVGMVFQEHLLFPHLDVRGNLRYGQRYRRGRRRSIALARVVEVLEIGDLLGRYPRNLSGGERQRVALGRALLSDPELLLMDEPLAAIDAPLKARILAYLERVAAEWEVPVLFVTHSQAEVRRLADWVVILDSGRIVAGGTPQDALSRPEPLGWKNSMGPVNLLRVEEVESASDHLMGRIAGQRVHLPPQDSPVGAACFVQFGPADVTLSRREIAGLSARNHLKGLIRDVVAFDRAVFVSVDIGQLLWAEVTPEAAAELQLVPGSQVTCLLKAHSLRVLN
ncbi:MAG: molybdenum ABC transporter ATP-binding protein [Pirellulales bacterium]|nr:molybdenum ABC transporter ATP-binding protein [Pirellulales bacterium]